MKRIIGIAPLIIALILGTCLSSQAQIVMVQPMPIDGGFGMFYHLRGKAVQKTDNNMVKNSIHSTNDSETNIAQYPDLTQEKKYYTIEYEVKYSICTYNGNRRTDLQSGSYYCKLVGCKLNNESISKDLN
ncbi:MAG: hypothetical protein KQH67_05195 [Bacteroidetes bacterium]|nr:hypothetical protein [Bacteroidota bacterium]